MLKLTGILLLLLAYVLLYPGLTEPMLSVTGTVEKEKLVELGREFISDSNNPSLLTSLANRFIDGIDTRGSVDAFSKTQSVLGTAAELRANGHLPVALLIVLFSVIIPLVKGLLVLAAQFPFRAPWPLRLGAIGNVLSKWSMADVFAVAIFVAYLAARGLQSDTALVDFDAMLGPGYWYFLGYCLLSILASQLLFHALRRQHSHTTEVPLDSAQQPHARRGSALVGVAVEAATALELAHQAQGATAASVTNKRDPDPSHETDSDSGD